jgi:splicing factor 3B subunit 3
LAGIYIICQGAFFFLLQSEDGDLFKVTIDHEDEDVRALKIKYFDTVPVAASLCILKSGFLFVASEFGDQYVLNTSVTDNQAYCPEVTSISSKSSEMMTTSLNLHQHRTRL